MRLPAPRRILAAWPVISVALASVSVAGARAAEPPAAGAPPSQPPAVASRRGAPVARVNGALIYQADLDSAIANFSQSNQLPDPLSDEQRQEIRSSMLDGLIGTELLYQRAIALKIEMPPSEVDDALRRTIESMGPEIVRQEMEKRGMSEAELRDLVKQNLLVQRMLKETVIDPLVVPEEEIRKFYAEHPEQMQRPEAMKASQILVRWTPADGPEKKAAARQRIDKALARARAGEEFAALAREYSEDQSGPSGGDLGTIYRGQTVPPFDEAAFKLKAGEISEVVETTFGFHIIRSGAHQAAGVAPIEEVRGPLGDFLRQQRTQEAIEKLVTDLRAAAKVEIL